VTEESSEQSTSDPGSSGNLGIRDLIERAFLVGMGAASLTKDRAQSLVDELVRRGQLSGEDGRDMVEKLVSRSREEARTALQRADSSMQGTYRNLGLVSKRELEDMDFRMRQLEHRVQLLEAVADKGQATD
jgi:polyhydroxyalkanoate synthesis regulator phasin